MSVFRTVQTNIDKSGLNVWTSPFNFNVFVHTHQVLYIPFFENNGNKNGKRVLYQKKKPQITLSPDFGVTQGLLILNLKGHAIHRAQKKQSDSLLFKSMCISVRENSTAA